MATPKTTEEQKIYEEMKRNIQNGPLPKGELKWLEKVKNDQSDKRDWKTIKEEYEELE